MSDEPRGSSQSVAASPLRVVIYWHMHQPEYRDLRSGEYHLPWTYLHGIKDYVDMAAHLETIPEARAVVNFAPILLVQIDDYARQIRGFLNNSSAIRDPLLAALAGPILPAANDARMSLIKHCLRANEDRLIKRFPVYQKLAEAAKALENHPEMMLYINDQYLVDLLIWYHLAWMGETVRREDTRIKKLMDKGTGFSLHDRRELTAIIGELMGGIIGRYRKLAEAGQVELSMTPYAHPIMPLLLDITSAREAMPDVKLPFLTHYPGGKERVRWHLQKGMETFEHYFGFKASGCWPSEGSISEATLEMLDEAGFRWTASGESVMRNSLHASKLKPKGCLHRPYRFDNSKTACFFRDDGLSDLIGFTYASWHADDAVANLLHHLENIATACSEQNDSVVSIILDGENAWETYPENGYYFLQALYKGIANHPALELTTYSACLEQGTAPKMLSHVVAGSWVYGTFSTWIGDKDKNHAWDMLGEAKRIFDVVMKSGRLDKEHQNKAEHQLAICEGSDWFWWFGDYNPADSVSDFECLFRLHLAHLYQILGEEPPDYLSEVFTHGSGAPAMSGVMRPGQEHT